MDLMSDLTAEDKNFLVQVACFTTRRRLEGANSPPIVVPSSKTVLHPAGTFVSLHTKGNHALRGCIGRIDASLPLLANLGNVSWLVVTDPRFANQPVTLAELPSLTIEISVLGLLTPTANVLDFDPAIHGIYLGVGGRAGVFLTSVARETGWNREQLLDRLCSEKLGLPPRTWQDPSAKLFTFNCLTIGPTDFVFDELPVQNR
jgi:uncharacterized protein (TIGR00296 family)